MIIKIKPNGLLSILKNHTGLSLMILITPFSGMAFISSNILGITGFKLLNVIAITVFLSWLIKGGEVVTFTNSVRARASLIIYVYIALLIFEFLRSYVNLDELVIRNTVNFGEYRYSSFGYILSYLIKPLLYTVSFIYIINHVKTIVILEKLTDLLLYSLFFFAVATLFISADLVISGQYRGLLRDTFKSIFGLHYNSVATILMLGLPLALSRSLSSGRGWVIIFGTLTVALLFAQSRGAILGGISGIMAFLYLQRKLDARLLIAIIFIGLLGFVLSDIIITLFSRGLESRDFSEISSGRLDSMWIPLISELTTNPYRILFGFGLYGMIMTDAYMFSSDFFQATHAHNAYLNLIVDGGLIVFLPFVFLLFYSFKHAMTISRKFNNSTFNALLSSVIVYLVAGMSGRQFTPNTGNAMLFIIIAILVTIVITKKQAK
jgi:hypothetical protein